MQSVHQKLKVVNPSGIHARPASELVKFFKGFKSKVWITCNANTVEGKEVLNLLLLEAKYDTLLNVEVKGDDANLLVDKLNQQFTDLLVRLI